MENALSGNRPSVELASSPTKTVAVEAIERELADLWLAFGSDAKEQEAVTRACMSNLVIFCSTDVQAQPILQHLPTIVRMHPSRILLLIGEAASPDAPLEAYVSALCHVTGDRRQVCSEHITVSARGESIRRLPSAARPLLVGDVPTTLWWASTDAPPLRPELFGELSELADQVIYDSRGWPDPVRAVVATARWSASDQTPRFIADLAWCHLKPWRRLVSQALDPAVVPGALESIAEVVVDHGPHALPQSWLLVGWLACLLGWKPSGGKLEPGVEVTWRFESARGPLRVTIRRLSDGPPEVRTASIAWKSKGAGRRTFSVLEEGRLGVFDGDSAVPSAVLTIPPRETASLVARQLSNRGRDTLFRSTLQVSRTMAEALSR